MVELLQQTEVEKCSSEETSDRASFVDNTIQGLQLLVAGDISREPVPSKIINTRIISSSNILYYFSNSFSGKQGEALAHPTPP